MQEQASDKWRLCRPRLSDGTRRSARDLCWGESSILFAKTRDFVEVDGHIVVVVVVVAGRKPFHRIHLSDNLQHQRFAGDSQQRFDCEQPQTSLPPLLHLGLPQHCEWHDRERSWWSPPRQVRVPVSTNSNDVMNYVIAHVVVVLREMWKFLENLTIEVGKLTEYAKQNPETVKQLLKKPPKKRLVLRKNWGHMFLKYMVCVCTQTENCLKLYLLLKKRNRRQWAAG